MAKSKLKEIKDRETGHLQQELIEKHRHLFDLRSQAVTEKLEDPSQLRKTRKDIARIKTVMRERELGDRTKKSETTEKPKATTTKTKTKRSTKAKSKSKSKATSESK